MGEILYVEPVRVQIGGIDFKSVFPIEVICGETGGGQGCLGKPVMVGPEEQLMILIVWRGLMKVFTQINGIDAIFAKAGKKLVCIGIGEIIAAA